MLVVDRCKRLGTCKPCQFHQLGQMVLFLQGSRREPLGTYLVKAERACSAHKLLIDLSTTFEPPSEMKYFASVTCWAARAVRYLMAIVWLKFDDGRK